MGETKKFFSMSTPDKKSTKKSGGGTLSSSSKLILETVEKGLAEAKKEKPQIKLIPVAGTKNRVFVEPVSPSKFETRASGFVVVKDSFGAKHEEDGEKKWENYGKVISVSEIDESGVKPNVKTGDIVYFDPNFQEREFEGFIYLVMREGNIYAKL